MPVTFDVPSESVKRNGTTLTSGLSRSVLTFIVLIFAIMFLEPISFYSFCSLKGRKFRSQVDLAHLGQIDETDLIQGALSQTIEDTIVAAEKEDHDLGQGSVL